MNSNSNETFTALDIVKNGVYLARAHAGYSPYENGSAMVVARVDQGDRISVDVGAGGQFYGSDYTTFSGFRISSD